MTAIASEFPAQAAAPFSLTMEVEEDIEEEIEAFVRFKRRGEYEQAEEVFREALFRHLSFFPVIAEYADFLLVQEKYRILSEFLDIQMQYMEAVLEEEEMELLRIMKSLVNIHTKGSLRPALEQAQKTWEFLSHRSTSMPPDTLPGDVEIHIFEIYINIIVFALRTSNWVRPDKMNCPWSLSQHSDHCGFVQWYLVLSTNGHLWSASQVLLNLLQALPSFESHDAMILFDNFCFGNIADEGLLRSLNEMYQLIACSVSFGRAQALLDLTFLLCGVDPNDTKREKLYQLALGYNRVADFLPRIIHHDNTVRLVDLRAYIQRIQFESVQDALFRRKRAKPKVSAPPLDPASPLEHTFPGTLVKKDPRCFYIWYFRSARDYVSGLSKDLLRPPSPSDLQQHDQGTCIRFIQTCDLCCALMDNFLDGSSLRTLRPPIISSEVDSFLPLWLPPSSTETVKVTKYMKDLAAQLEVQMQHTLVKEGLALDFRQPPEAAAFNKEKPALFDIPLYVWALVKDQEWLSLRPWESPDSPDAHYFPRSYKKYEEALPKRPSKETLIELAAAVLEASQNRGTAEEEVSPSHSKETNIDKESKLDATPRATRRESASNKLAEIEIHSSSQRAEKSAMKTSSDQSVTFTSLLTSKSAAQSQSETTKELPLPSHEEKLDSYTKICQELRADLMKGFQLREDHDRRFAQRGTAEGVLRGDTLVQFVRCLELQESIVEHLFPSDRVIAEVLVDKRLQDFLAILIFSMCDIKAARNFITQVLFPKSRSARSLEVPTTRKILEELFEDRTAANGFFANQSIFCAPVFQEGKEVVIPSLDDRRLPYLEEQLMSQGPRVKVFKVKIAAGHVDRHGTINSWPADVVRKDYTKSGNSGKLQSSIEHRIFSPILSLKRSCVYVVQILCTLAISPSTYSVFMPLATCNLQQYMMENYARPPPTYDERAEIVRNTLGLTEGLCFLHTALKTKNSFICLDFGLNPDNVLVFGSVWKLSDFGMSYITFREHIEEDPLLVRKVVRERYTRPFQSKSLNPLRIDERIQGTYLAPNFNGDIQIRDNRSGVWSLGCVISVVFAYMEEGPEGVTGYAEARAKHWRAGGFDRFFLRSRYNQVHHPAVKNWHSRIISRAKSRDVKEGKAVESILRFLETAVFRKDSDRCDAETLRKRLHSAWEQYRKAHQDRDLRRPTWIHELVPEGDESQSGTSRVNRFFQFPRTAIRRVFTHGEEDKEEEEQPNEPDEWAALVPMAGVRELLAVAVRQQRPGVLSRVFRDSS